MLLCDCCGITLESRSRLKWHKRKHESDGPYQCAHCSLRFDNIQMLQTHVVEGLKDVSEHCMTYCVPVIKHPSSLVCGICDAVFQVDCQMSMHMTRHVKEKLSLTQQLQIFKYTTGGKKNERGSESPSKSEQSVEKGSSILKADDVSTAVAAIEHEEFVETDPTPPEPMVLVRPTLVSIAEIKNSGTKPVNNPPNGLKKIFPKPAPVLVTMVPSLPSYLAPASSLVTAETNFIGVSPSAAFKSVGVNTVTPPKAKKCRLAAPSATKPDQCNRMTQTQADKQAQQIDNPCLDVSLSSVDMQELQAMLDKPGDGSVAAAEEILLELVANNPADFRHDFGNLAANFNVDFSSNKK